MTNPNLIVPPNVLIHAHNKRLRQTMIRCLTLLVCGVIFVGCNRARPTAAPKPTVVPAATVGALNEVYIQAAKLRLVVPSTWQAPKITDDTIMISPNDSTDTSFIAAPFVSIIADATVISKRYSFTFPTDASPDANPDASDPMVQLPLLLRAINRDGSRFSKPVPYGGAKYPAAISTGFERGNQLTIYLIYANKRWLLVGTQTLESYYPYYNEAVFAPLINSLTVDVP